MGQIFRLQGYIGISRADERSHPMPGNEMDAKGIWGKRALVPQYAIRPA